MQEKTPIALLIGRGSRTPALFKHLDQPGAGAEIVAVVSHKALDPDSRGQKTMDVTGIAEAKKRGIRSAYYNFVQMKKAAKEVNPDLDEQKFRKDYFRMLGAYLCQNYPRRPEIVFMLGWDLVVSAEFLKFFPGPKPGVYNVVNLHPALLSDQPGGLTVQLSNGETIPVLHGEHDLVIAEALRLKLPALGACMHYTQKEADLGGLIIKKVEVPIFPNDTLESYEKRLKPAEEKLVIETIDLLTKNKI